MLGWSKHIETTTLPIACHQGEQDDMAIFKDKQGIHSDDDWCDGERGGSGVHEDKKWDNPHLLQSEEISDDNKYLLFELRLLWPDPEDAAFREWTQENRCFSFRMIVD